MLIAQISDLHIGFVPDDPDEMNTRRLESVIAHIAALPRRPDMLIASGDLTERGDAQSYERLRAMLAKAPMPVHYALGNHDVRATFAQAFPEVPQADGFVQYALEDASLRVLVLDTLEEGRHGGAFCAIRADWLAARLDEAPDVPTLLILHHPPFPTGIGWMTTDPAEPWVARLQGALAGRSNVVGLASGHIHRPILGRLGDLSVAVCPSTAPAVALTLEAIDPANPDGRAMIVDTSPAYALHLWEDGRLVTHFMRVEPPQVIVAYDATMQPLVARVFAERPRPA